MDSIEQAREKIRKYLGNSEKKETETQNLLAEKKFCLLIVEDEELNLQALVDTFKKEYDVLAFNSAVEALTHIKTSKPKIDVVLTDQRMPRMSGMQFLEELNKIYPDVMKLILTGYTETRDLIDAINKGEVYRYITKPADPAYLKSEVKQALEKYKVEQEKNQRVFILMEEKKALEVLKNYLKEVNLDILRILETLSEFKDRDISRHTVFVAQACEYIAGKLGMNQGKTLEIIQAAHLHDIGKMGLPDWVLTGAGSITEMAENYYRQHPLLGEAVLLTSEYLKDVALTVRHHHEWWNGGGFPDGLKGEEIPLASRIIAVSDSYDEYFTQHRVEFRTEAERKEKSVKFLTQNEGVRFDPGLIKPFLEFMRQEKPETKERFLSFDELQEGMVISQDVLTEGGFVLIPKMTRLTKGFLSKVKGISNFVGIRQPISVYE